jgi:SAM-dependent methyltransferase
MSSIAQVYDADPEREWCRLARDPYHSLEFLVTWHYLQKHLPPNGRILDAGGGPGRYALELCRAGYDVVLLDLSAGLISMAQDKFVVEPASVRNRLSDAVVGDIRDLSQFGTGTFDAVLCLGGPLTHIGEPAGRQMAMSELVRVAKPGAIVCMSVMGRLAALRTSLAKYSDTLLAPSFQMLVDKGNVLKADSLWHFYRADELRRQAEQCGLTTMEMAGCEGLSTGMAEATNLLGQDEKRWKRWVDLVLQTSALPGVVDMAEHILYVGRAEMP